MIDNTDGQYAVPIDARSNNVIEGGGPSEDFSVTGATDYFVVMNGSAHEHTEVVVPGTPATCLADGITDGLVCSVCGLTRLEQEVIPATGHFPEDVPAVAPTCTEPGLTDGKKCSVCNAELAKQDVIAALGHTEATVDAKEATCAEAGLTEGKSCSVCGTVLVAQNEVPALAHTYDNDCDADCNVCGATRTPASHVYGEWTVVAEATADEAGKQERACTVCGAVDSEEIAALGRNSTVVIVVAAVAAVAVVGAGVAVTVSKKKKA